MKTFRMFSILLIGMISLTVTAKTTATLEQKQKTELTKVMPSVNFVSVVIENSTLFVNRELVKNYSRSAKTKTLFNPVVNILTVTDDVGWENVKINSKLANYDTLYSWRKGINNTSNKKTAIIRIRDNC
ncbi:hypothetical protein OX284_014140 [Flavobacterium sp. SUN046]|uniref:hypothetical protein n=1 Tax=Flavobacterium sp. SUN046 TaxID=3002440 RepID=UPI002DBC90D7|nr:hypothetical protein [Flavobacterium sp. SUN046]MEC4050576.1 hypothetical protein [Flavobacterium sp. SUN046]